MLFIAYVVYKPRVIITFAGDSPTYIYISSTACKRFGIGSMLAFHCAVHRMSQSSYDFDSGTEPKSYCDASDYDDRTPPSRRRRHNDRRTRTAYTRAHMQTRNAGKFGRVMRCARASRTNGRRSTHTTSNVFAEFRQQQLNNRKRPRAIRSRQTITKRDGVRAFAFVFNNTISHRHDKFCGTFVFVGIFPVRNRQTHTKKKRTQSVHHTHVD